MLYHLSLSTYCLNLLLSSAGENCSLNSEIFGEFALAEYLNAVLSNVGNDTLSEKSCAINYLAVIEFVERLNIYYRVLLAEEVVLETSLGELTVKRKLTSLEAGSNTAAGTCVLALVTLTSGFSVTGTCASALTVVLDRKSVV